MRIRLAEGASIAGVAFLVVCVLVAACGWVFNIIEIFNIANQPITGMFIFRIIGIFVAPLGAILGYL